MNTLQRTIMRRIYYAYMLRLVSLPGVWQGFFMVGVMSMLTHFVSITHVFENLAHVEVGQVGMFFYNAVRSTEIWTLVLIGVFMFLSLSFRISLKAPERREFRFA